MLIGLWVAVIAFTAWNATGPDPYLDGLHDPQFERSYPWIYPVFALVIGGILIGLLMPWRSTHSFVGASLAFVICFSASLSLLFSIMHAHPVHGNLGLIFFVLALGLLFYSGFAFAVWRSQRKRADPSK